MWHLVSGDNGCENSKNCESGIFLASKSLPPIMLSSLLLPPRPSDTTRIVKGGDNSKPTFHEFIPLSLVSVMIAPLPERD
jgi:hypothetical protein